MKNLIITVCTALLLTLSFSSCKEKGCTDKDAKNYCEDCKDDGNCTYEGKAVFWFNQATADSLINDGATSLTYYINGEVAGSAATNVYWTGAPDCGQSGSVTIVKDLGTSKSKSFTYSVKDQTGFEYFDGTIAFNANTCLATQLVW